jgi:hypothetical protein
VTATSYPIRIAYAIWRYQTQGSFLGLRGQEFIDWIRTAEALQ